LIISFGTALAHEKLDMVRLGRVAAGAIAEKYLKIAHGIEIVAFVSSVGKVHLPVTVTPPPTDGVEDSDEVPDALSSDFRQLLATVTRAEIDKYPTRCPHPETAERMTKVWPHSHINFPSLTIIPSASYGPKIPKTR
jgi:Chorismate synthase